MFRREHRADGGEGRIQTRAAVVWAGRTIFCGCAATSGDQGSFGARNSSKDFVIERSKFQTSVRMVHAAMVVVVHTRLVLDLAFHGPYVLRPLFPRIHF